METRIERLSSLAKKFVIFLYKKFGRGDFTYSDVRIEMKKIPFKVRVERFGSLDEGYLHTLAKRYNVLNMRPHSKRKMIYSFTEEALEEIEKIKDD